MGPAAAFRQVEDSAHGEIEDPIQTRAMRLERARVLGRRLRIQVAIDDTGWLRSEIELVFTKAPTGTLEPITVRVGCEASNDDVLAQGGVAARCESTTARSASSTGSPGTSIGWCAAGRSRWNRARR